MIDKLDIMLRLQDDMNTKVHRDWRDQGFTWYRAIWIECGELMDHYGWKWWKFQEPDMEQVKLELIDIWHFGLSQLLVEGVAVKEIATQYEMAVGGEDTDFRDLLETFTVNTLTHKQFSIHLFKSLLDSVGMDFDELYVRYVGKNVLNFFRQDHGYKTGEYKKLWNGREDNEHLVEIASQLDNESPTFADDLYQALSNTYQQNL